MGFLISKEYPSRFVNGSEIEKPITVTIQAIKKEQVYNQKTNSKEQTLVVYLKGGERGIALGKQRATDLKAITGSDDTDGWVGQQAIMYTEPKNAGGRQVQVIRFKALTS